jgi:SRSO17 transposase
LLIPHWPVRGGFFFFQENTSMTTSEVRAAAAELVTLHSRFASLFGRKEAQAHSRVYLNGLLLGQGRKSAEPIALAFGEPGGEGSGQSQVIALQRFLSSAPWDYWAVQREIQRAFADRLILANTEWPIGTVGIIDGSTFVKKGSESVGVKRQYCGRLGKVENCQAGVFLTGVTPAGTVLLDHQLYLPQEWARDKKRREKVHVPKEIRFQTQPQIAAEMLRRTQQAGLVRFDWVVADEGFGRYGGFLDALEEMGQPYLLEVPSDTTVWTEGEVPAYGGCGRRPRRSRRNAVRSVRVVAENLPTQAWQNYQIRQGAQGPLVFQFAAVRVNAMRHRKEGPAIWLVIRRSLGPQVEIKYYVSNASADTRLETFALVSGCRFRVEEYLAEAKSYLGMAQYEARGWASWHHHMSLVALAHLYVTLTRMRLKKKSDLTLDMALKLLRHALPKTDLTLDTAMDIMEYHLCRNRRARQSHDKAWRERHKQVKFKLLL